MTPTIDVKGAEDGKEKPGQGKLFGAWRDWGSIPPQSTLAGAPNGPDCQLDP
jgi:hypothetical protein